MFAVVFAEMKLYFPTEMLIMLPSNLRHPSTVSSSLRYVHSCPLCPSKVPRVH